MIHWDYGEIEGSHTTKIIDLDASLKYQKRSIYGKRKSDKESVGPAKKINHAWGIPKFLPPLPEGEDEHSIAHHCDTLKSLTALPQERRNKDTVCVLMVKTFPDKRQMLVNEFKHIR